MLSQKELENQVKKALAEQAKTRCSTVDSIKITPYVSFFEGTVEHPIKHIASTKGRLVANGLIAVTNYLGISALNTNDCGMHDFAVGAAGIPAVPSIRLGTGTTATAYNTTQLATIIATPPDTITGSISNPSEGVYKIVISATWDAGAIGTPTVTEAALYAYVPSILQAFNVTGVTASVVLIDRVCSTDADFTSFTVNASNPLTIQYTVQVAYA